MHFFDLYFDKFDDSHLPLSLVEYFDKLVPARGKSVPRRSSSLSVGFLLRVVAASYDMWQPITAASSATE